MRFRIQLLSAIIFFTLGFWLATLEDHEGKSRQASLPVLASASTQPQLAYSTRNSVQSICDKPLSIEIAHVDPEFKLSAQDILVALKNAVNEWRDATGREWFRIESGGMLKVNFLFDGRQSTFLEMEMERLAIEEQIQHLNMNPLRSRAEISFLQSRIDSYRNKFESSKAPIPSAQHYHDSGGTSIDVFAFSDKEQLHATLLHELGHALGLGHLPQQKSIMHAVQITQESDVHLSQYDVEAALSLCERR